jgi:hypothetical protein
VSDEERQNNARMAEEAKRRAQEAGARAEVQAEQTRVDALTGETGEEMVRQLGLIYGGLILIGVYMVQPFLTAAALDAAAKLSVIAFSVAIPLLAALIMVNRQEAFRRRQTPSALVTVARVLAQSLAFVGIVAGFWHVQWIAGVSFLVTGVVAVGVHSAGWWRLEQGQTPAP